MSNQRPLSPHLQIYKPQLTSVLSIMHRATGIVIAMGAIFIAIWIWAAAGDGSCYETMQGILQSVFGKIVMIIWTFCTFYHLCNGIRHLFWDVGMGFELNQAYLSGKIVVAAAVLLTIAGWLL